MKLNNYNKVFYNYDFRYNFQIVPDMIIPEWAYSSINYQIYTDRFNNGDTSNDVVDWEWMNRPNESPKKLSPEEKEYVYTAKDWNDFPDVYDVNKFYNGDLEGLRKKLKYLKSIGVSCLYLNPIFLSPSNHRYNIQSYEYIDPHIGKIVNDCGEVLTNDQKENRFATKYINRVTNKEKAGGN